MKEKSLEVRINMGEAEDFIAALGLALLLGVSIVVILEIIEELIKANKPASKENIIKKVDERRFR